MEQKTTHTIDATGQALGRLATNVAILLRGKYRPTYKAHIDAGDTVIVKNADGIRLTGRKIGQKMYYRHSGYLGGLTETPIKRLLEERPSEVIKQAVFGMLPKNKLRSKYMRRLKFA